MFREPAEASKDLVVTQSLDRKARLKFKRCELSAGAGALWVVRICVYEFNLT